MPSRPIHQGRGSGCPGVGVVAVSGAASRNERGVSAWKIGRGAILGMLDRGELSKVLADRAFEHEMIAVALTCAPKTTPPRTRATRTGRRRDARYWARSAARYPPSPAA